MFRPLVDIDANSRHTGVKVSQPAAKTRSPMALPSADSEHRRNPFRVSASGSPRYMTHKASPMASLTPTVGSKIPRKAGTPTLPRRSQMGVGATSRAGTKAIAGGPSAIPKPAHSPPVNRHKPLPSPPIAQYVNPASPPKAQRTLVDAEVAGTPTSEEWPILSPENVPSEKSSPMSAASSMYSKDDRTPQSAQRQDGDHNIELPSTVPLDTCYKGTASPAPESSTDHGSLTRSERARVRSSDILGSPPTTVHAITTAHDEALDSPLARKLAIPPRISLKRRSLPLPNKGPQPSVHTVAPVTISRRQQTKPGSTKWPLLDAKRNKESPSASVPLIPGDDVALDVENNGPDAIGSKAHGVPESADTCHSSLTQQASLPSTSTCSLATGCSLDNELLQDPKPGDRVRCLSGGATGYGLGPILRIAKNADSVLLGQGNSTPDVPPVPDADPSKTVQGRSLSALAGRISRQTMSRMSIINISSRSNTPQLVENETDANSIITIDPIRSMQPPREAIVDHQLRSSSSPVPLPSWISRKHSKLPTSSSSGKRDALATSHTMTPWKPEDSERRSFHVGGLPIVLQEVGKSEYTAEVYLSKAIPPKASQVLGVDANSSDPVIPKNTPKNSPKNNPSKAKKLTADRDRMGASLIRSAHRNSCNVATKDVSAASRSSPASRASRYRGENSPGLNKAGSTKSATPGPGVTAPELREPSMSAGNKMPMQSRPNTQLSPKCQNRRDFHGKNDGNAKQTAAKIKAKRSFRDFFHIRDGKRTEKAPKPAENKRSSLTATGNTLAKRFRHSANFSKPNLPTASESETPVHSEPEAKLRTHDRDDHEIAPSNATPEAPPATCSETAIIVNNIVNHVSSLPNNSPDRLRGLEIAEILLNSVDAYKQAKISATKAKKHARQAELNAERAGVELERLQKLCEPDFDHETVQAIKELVKCVDSIGRPEQSSHSSGKVTPTQ